MRLFGFFEGLFCFSFVCLCFYFLFFFIIFLFLSAVPYKNNTFLNFEFFLVRVYSLSL